MIKQMEKRFAIVAILVVSTVLLTLIILVNAISINVNIRRADDALLRLSGDWLQEDNLQKPPENLPSLLPDIDKRNILKEENRSFEVVVDQGLSLIFTNAYSRNLLDDATAYEYTLTVLEDSEVSGFIGGYRYMVIDEAGKIKVIFLDYSIEKIAEQNFMLISIGVYFVAVILTTLLVIILLKPVMKSIKESYAKQKRFITDASHELKTPLTVIATNMEIIEMDTGASDWITSVNTHVQKLNTLTNELVMLSRMDEEGNQVVLVEVNLSEIVNDVVMGFEPAINAKGKILDIDVEDEVRIKGNYDGLERVMSVIMNNALKYSDDQGHIWVNLHRKGKKIYLSIRNTVDAIEQGSHNVFLERFYRSDASRNSETGGFGIGLAVAQSIVEEHHGKIDISSKDTRSLEVMITL